MDLIDWDQYFMSMAYLTAMKSKDTSTKVGCVIVGPDNEIRSTGYNSFPRGLNDSIPTRMERPMKYSYVEHAERNAIYNAALIGVSCKDSRMYMPWLPCVECARAIIQSGIREIVMHSEYPGGQHADWPESMRIAQEMLSECGVVTRSWSGSIVMPTAVNNGVIHTLK